MRIAAALLLVVSSACFFREPRVFSESLRDVPSVVGQTVSEAATALESEGFLVRVQTPGAPDEQSLDPKVCPSARVDSQDPSPSQALRASTVTIVVAGCP